MKNSIPKIPKKVFTEFIERFKEDKNKAIAWLFAYAYRKGQYDLYKELGLEIKYNANFEKEAE